MKHLIATIIIALSVTTANAQSPISKHIQHKVNDIANLKVNETINVSATYFIAVYHSLIDNHYTVVTNGRIIERLVKDNKSITYTQVKTLVNGKMQTTSFNFKRIK
ncbi:hypothetical protein [Wenyingzhuangia sp. 2_MG-2023]|uniref:hypothetical protein n=1 Tax=Wenyingzhuangia sp. 2_MG-2023 TaxID=3062639 RepID=UPI0026E285D2|nr:hypothetical protein [Wenyingzhuangia sp. 2_MG-2023]MDO6737066.1 hypothetical protein [Wenyingzhuangia sp. 2_MG-2023]